jgi:hypothetical protein
MKKIKLLMVSGTFNRDDGKPSKSMTNLFSEFGKSSLVESLELYNGGNVSEIPNLLERTKEANVVLWFPNIDNSEEKLRNVKDYNPKCILVNSKVNNGRYTFMELVKKALDIKANLTLELNTLEKPFQMMLMDPLANYFYKGTDINELAKIMIKRIYFLLNMTRKETVYSGPAKEIPNEEKFFNFIRASSITFHSLINPAPTTRFLGNASFRCESGFPSFRRDDIIYVSRRNVDKMFIDQTGFVATQYGPDDKILYYGDNKPSVDTPIQLELYQELPNIRYILHSHVYIEGAKFTDESVPCGSLEEVQKIMSVIENRNTTFEIINLVGHGCIILSDDVEKMEKVTFISRPAPEKIEIK